MKIAYCIICHKYTPVLRELVLLTGPRNDIYLHVDAKADIADFAPLADHANFIENRVEVAWGKYSQIEATLRTLDATRRGECDYIALISGDTLPVRSDADIKRYLWENRGRQFLIEEPLIPKHIDRVRYRHPAEVARSRGMLLKAWRKFQKVFGLAPKNRYFDTLPPLGFGSNWFVITPEFRDYIFDFLGQHPEYTEAFRHSQCGDELFFMTILKNSPFAPYADSRRFMYADWTTGPQYPRTLDETDFDRLEAAASRNDSGEHILYARKFADGLDLAAYRDRFIHIDTTDGE